MAGYYLFYPNLSTNLVSIKREESHFVAEGKTVCKIIIIFVYNIIHTNQLCLRKRHGFEKGDGK